LQFLPFNFLTHDTAGFDNFHVVTRTILS